MNKTILSFEEYTILNESFKSKIISRLFQEGEIDTEDVYQKSLFNQVTDDEIIGIADNEEAAKKMLHDTLGDREETRYKMHRTWHRVGPDDWDDDWEEDLDSPYTFNKTVDGYIEWIFKLNSGKFLVLRVEKRDLNSRLSKIRDPRYCNKRYNETQSEFRRKFQKRKEFVEKNKKDFEKYWEFKKTFEEKGLWDEFVNKAKEELNNMADRITGAEHFESDVCSCEDSNYYFDDDFIKFKIGEFTIEFYVEGEFDANVRCWDEPGDYWTPPDSGCEITDGKMYINSISIYVDGPEEFEITYLPKFDKDADLCDIDYSL
jgi:hypothetical protein